MTETGVVIAESAMKHPRVSELLTALELPVIPDQDCRPEVATFVLFVDDKALSLKQISMDSPGPVRVDFSEDRLAYRAQDSLFKQGLLKSLGRLPPDETRILDATAGLGGDGFLLATAGFEVVLLERNPVVHALLSDGLMRAVENATESATENDSGLAAVCERMQLVSGEFPSAATTLGDFDVVYLDPMFTRRHKSARSKKSMQFLQSLIPAQSETEQDQLLLDALELARKRVIVKRGKNSPFLAGRRPDVQYKGRSNRFDVYLQAPV